MGSAPALLPPDADSLVHTASPCWRFACLNFGVHSKAPFYLRRLKEALVTFPDPDTGLVKALFTERKVRTAPFQIIDRELDLYDQLTHYVEDQSIKAARKDSARARAVGFTMAMLQRRFASRIYAVRRTQRKA